MDPKFNNFWTNFGPILGSFLGPKIAPKPTPKWDPFLVFEALDGSLGLILPPSWADLVPKWAPK